eukprot:scaffold291254_cov36-Cyclotella_meneghiniana.AAC.1
MKANPEKLPAKVCTSLVISLLLLNFLGRYEQDRTSEKRRRSMTHHAPTTSSTKIWYFGSTTGIYSSSFPLSGSNEQKRMTVKICTEG